MSFRTFVRNLTTHNQKILRFALNDKFDLNQLKNIYALRIIRIRGKYNKYESDSVANQFQKLSLQL